MSIEDQIGPHISRKTRTADVQKIGKTVPNFREMSGQAFMGHHDYTPITLDGIAKDSATNPSPDSSE